MKITVSPALTVLLSVMLLFSIAYADVSNRLPDVSNLPFGMTHEHMEAVSLMGEGKYLDVLITLRGLEDRPAYLLKGLAHFALKEFPASARELSLYSGEREPDADEHELYISSLRLLSLAYYNSDQLTESLDVLKRLMQYSSDRELLTFRMKIERELKGNDTRVAEASDHFKVIYDGYVHSKVDRMVLSILEDAYDEIGREFDHFPKKTITVVLDTRVKFYDITRSPMWAGGLFDDVGGRIRVPIDGIESFDKSELRRILRHEYVHALIFSITPNCPRWLHEGLAEHLTRGETGDLTGTGLMPLELLEASFYSPNVSIAYHESMKAVRALVENYGMYEIKLYLEALGRGESTTSAFESVFLIKYSEFADKLGS